MKKQVLYNKNECKALKLILYYTISTMNGDKALIISSRTKSNLYNEAFLKKVRVRCESRLQIEFSNYFKAENEQTRNILHENEPNNL